MPPSRQPWSALAAQFRVRPPRPPAAPVARPGVGGSPARRPVGQLFAAAPEAAVRLNGHAKSDTH